MKINNMYILEYTHLEKSRYKRYFNSVTEYKIYINMTDLKIQKELDNLNKFKRSNFWKIKRDFNFKLKRDKKDFIIFYINEYKNISKLNQYYEFYKNLCDEVTK